MPVAQALRPLFTTLFLAAGLAVAQPAVAAQDAGAGKPAKTTKHKHKEKEKGSAKAAGKVRFDKGSGETATERDRRLQRECKGRPNAGACLGYAS